MITKIQYRSRYWFYYPLLGLIKIIDGIITIFVSPFGYDSNVYSNFCYDSLKKDVARRKRNEKHNNITLDSTHRNS